MNHSPSNEVTIVSRSVTPSTAELNYTCEQHPLDLDEYFMETVQFVREQAMAKLGNSDVSDNNQSIIRLLHSSQVIEETRQALCAA